MAKDTLTRLHSSLLLCSRAYWGLALVYVILPFVVGARVGSTVFSVSVFGAGVLAMLGLMIYGASRYARPEREGMMPKYLLWWVAGVGWLAFALAALAAVVVVGEALIK